MNHNRDRLSQLAGECQRVRSVPIEKGSSAGEVRKLAVNAQLDHMRSGLAGAGNSRAAQLLIERVTHGCLTPYTLEAHAAREYQLSPGKVPAWDKEVEHAHRRFGRSVTELARLGRSEGVERIEETVNARIDGEPAQDDCAE